MNLVIGIIIGLVLLLSIAFPEYFVPNLLEKKKRVGPSYWGLYPGNEECTDEEMTIETTVNMKKDRVVAGSAMYALGRGVNMSGNSSK